MSLQVVVTEAPRGVLMRAPRSKLARQARVLIVDDLAENCLMLGLCCDQFGFEHEAVANGRDAVDLAETGRFDVILMDIFMPRMDGIAATHAIRALAPPVSHVPIIAVTTAAAPGEVMRYLSCGMDDVVGKPIDASRLGKALSAALSQGRRERSIASRASRRLVLAAAS